MASGDMLSIFLFHVSIRHYSFSRAACLTFASAAPDGVNNKERAVKLLHKDIQVSDLRVALRNASMPAHARLEALVEGRGYFDDLAAYRRWLSVMFEMHRAYAMAHDNGARALGLAPMSQALLVALAQDLGAHPKYNEPFKEADGIGVAYVFEGSAMGGRLLQRRLRQIPHAPTGYLNVLVETSGARWPAIKSALSGYEGDADNVVAEAIATFDAVYDAFEGAPR